MRWSTTAMIACATGAAFGGGVAHAQTSPQTSFGAFSVPGLTLAVGQKAWITSWSESLIDADVVVPGPGAPPVLRTFESTRVIEHVLPITNFVAKYYDVSLSATVSPTVRFSDSDTSTGKLSRSEFDVNLGYSINDYLSASLVYKAGKIDQVATRNATLLTGTSGDSRLKSLLLGLNGSAPVAPGLRLYGTVAYGPGRDHTRFVTGEQRARFTYSIGEIGLNYVAASNSLGSLVLNAGYRTQVVTLKDLNFATYSLTGVPIASDTRDVTSTTHGPIVGITVVF